MVGGKDMREFEDLVKRSVEESIETKRAISGALLPRLVAAAEILVAAYRAGNKAIFIGNGGSAADAQHLAAEMEGRFAFDRRPLPALALHANVSTLTAIGNDYGYEQVYTRTLRAHARPGDVVVAISTSGTSKNVVAAAKLKSELGIKVIALTGEGGGMLAELADVLIAVPSKSTARIQESHIIAGHLLCEWVEREMFASAAADGR
jgi:D-sedoheptulose 7-phosphate isomerase